MYSYCVRHSMLLFYANCGRYIMYMIVFVQYILLVYMYIHARIHIFGAIIMANCVKDARTVHVNCA